MKMKKKRLKRLEAMDHQLWLLNKLQCLLEGVSDSLADMRLSVSHARQRKAKKDEEKRSHGMDEASQEGKDAKIPASEEQMSQLLDQGVFQERWLSVRDADLWMHYLSEREGCS